MKQTHSIHPTVLKMCAAVALALGAGSALAAADASGSGAPQFVVETDRIIVKYRDSKAAANGAAARVAPDATAFALRREHLLAEVIASWAPGAPGRRVI